MEKNEPNQNKYDAALAKYNTQLDDTEVAAQVAKIIAEKVPGNHTEEVKKFLFHCIDLTTLNTMDSDESVMKFTQKVNQFDEEFPDLENVAAICVYPNFAEIVKSTLEVEDVKIACVSAGFPSSQTFTEVKVAETAMALMEGADEIDISRQIPEWRLRKYVRRDTGTERCLQGTSHESDSGNRRSEECFQYHESLYPIHVFGRRFHKDIYRETTTRCNPGSCLCNVPGY